MCFSIEFLARRTEKYNQRYKDILPPDFNQRLVGSELPLYYFVSGFSYPLLPLVTHSGIVMHQWGIIPFWIRDAEAARTIQSKTLNAMGETVFKKPSFRSCIATKRGLLGVNGFYEWREVNKTKYPYLIKTLSMDIFSLGCIYESWVNRATGEISNTFSILTTPANALMAKIHNTKKRMPLIIAPQDEAKWIDTSLKRDQIKALIKPYDKNDMTAYTISSMANKASANRNVPEIVHKLDYPELTL
ncbi:MAG: SOS response-associated peptidase [Bacteroidota bacterium]